MSSNSSTSSPPLLLEWLAGGVSNAITSGFLNPLDVAKTRIQTTSASLSTLGKLRWALSGLYSEGGIVGLWKPTGDAEQRTSDRFLRTSARTREYLLWTGKS